MAAASSSTGSEALFWAVGHCTQVLLCLHTERHNTYTHKIKIHKITLFFFKDQNEKKATKREEEEKRREQGREPKGRKMRGRNRELSQADVLLDGLREAGFHPADQGVGGLAGWREGVLCTISHTEAQSQSFPTCCLARENYSLGVALKGNLSWRMHCVAPGLHAPQESYECSPTQNCRFQTLQSFCFF